METNENVNFLNKKAVDLTVNDSLKVATGQAAIMATVPLVIAGVIGLVSFATTKFKNHRASKKDNVEIVN